MTTRPDGNESESAPRWTEQERKRFAAMIEPARKAAGLSQEDVADMSGVTRRTVGSAERGDKIPQASVLKRLMVAVDLYDDSLDTYSISTRRWLATLGPMIESIPERPRDIVLEEVVTHLAAEVARYASRPDLTAVSQDDVTLAAYDDDDLLDELEGHEEMP